jgi:hypothetical protein
MTKKHYILFLIWKFYQRLKGFKVGTIVKVYSEEKQKYIKGCITTIQGDSITDDKYDFYFGINFFEPHKGNVSDYYMWGSYYPKEFKYNPIDKIFYYATKNS